MAEDNKYSPSNSARLDLIGLLVSCPFNQDNPANCPLHHIRTLPMAERVAWLDRLPSEDVAALQSNHRHCLYLKERTQYSRP